MSLTVARYLFRRVEATVPSLSYPALVTILGGSRVREDATAQERLSLIPSQSVLYPAGRPTHWQYAGTVDFLVFFFPENPQGVLERLRQLANIRGEPLPINDPLVGTAALQVVSELQRGGASDGGFLGRLIALMMEQAYRVLTIPALAGTNPHHPHFARLYSVIEYIREHLDEDLSVPTLAARASLCVTHFRRLFQDATGIPPHRYVLSARLEKARKLLAITSMSISRIADECGFSNQSHLTSSFRLAHATTPAEYRLRVSSKSQG